jgi:hypothetical protein
MDIHKQLTTTIPQLARGQVWCRTCGTTQRVDSAQAMRSGWPKCCGYTMTIDSPDEQRALAAQPAAPPTPEETR